MIDNLYSLGFLNGDIRDIFFVVVFLMLTWFIVHKYVISYFKQRKWIQFVIFLFSFIFFLLMTVLISTNYVLSQKEYVKSREMFKKFAKKEIENDAIDWEYFGFTDGVKPGYLSRVDSISKSYGVNLIPVRDIIDILIIEKARVKYYENPRRSYLDKRNGLGWERKMDEALQPYIIDLRKK